MSSATGPMRCAHFDAYRCRSCALLAQPYADQLADKQTEVERLLAGLPGMADLHWLPPMTSAVAEFRNKAKMVVAGTAEAPKLGILDAHGGGIDLRDCPLHLPVIQKALPVLGEFVGRAAIEPYHLATRRGELKHLLVTGSPDGELMARFVLRSQDAVTRIRKHLPWLLAELPHLVVASVNLLPEHKAALEGDQEIVLTEQQTLRMRVAGVNLHLRPQSFFQTNTDVAAALYRQVGEWVTEVDPRSVVDLYCGVGGFALHCAAASGGATRQVLGIETSAEAVAAARQSAAELGLDRVRFEAADATTYDGVGAPDLVIVNPPRRGIGADLASRLDTSTPRHVVYSSCNARTLARDLQQMPSFAVRRGRVLDMFPHTSHYEVAVLLERR
jgi:23S rRNA (uracil747-C5)-methyltransferase